MSNAGAATPVPPARREPGILREEILVVLSLSLLASAAYAIIDLLSAPVNPGVVAMTFPQVGFDKQLVDFAVGLAPVWLVFHLLRREGESGATIGLARHPPWEALLSGTLLFVIVGAVGLGLYEAAIALDINRSVLPVPPMGHWWTVPVIFLGAAQAALLEEVVVLGYLVTRLRQVGWAPYAALAASCVLRGSYHLYQGWGGFIANVLLGVVFGIMFLRRGRLWPMVIAHFLLDVGAGIGYMIFHGHLPGVAPGLVQGLVR